MDADGVVALTASGTAAVVAVSGQLLQRRKDRREELVTDADLLQKFRAIAAEEIEAARVEVATSRAEVAAARAEVAELRGRVEALERRTRLDSQWIKDLLAHVDFLRSLILSRWPDAALPPVPTEPVNP